MQPTGYHVSLKYSQFLSSATTRLSQCALYYDQLDLLTQLGQTPAPSTAKRIKTSALTLHALLVLSVRDVLGSAREDMEEVGLSAVVAARLRCPDRLPLDSFTGDQILEVPVTLSHRG
jgi:hypothetical protein